MKDVRRSQHTSQEREALLGLECALPSRELRLANTEAPIVRRSLWRRAINWFRSGFGERRAPAN